MLLMIVIGAHIFNRCLKKVISEWVDKESINQKVKEDKTKTDSQKAVILKSLQLNFSFPES